MNEQTLCSVKSGFYEQLVEHVFISELLQEAWFSYGSTVEVLRSEIDSSGYDLVLECNNILRHVQLKNSRAEGKTASQKVNTALAQKPSSCVVWIIRHESSESHRMSLKYLYYGDAAGKPLPSLNHFKIAKHTKANALGEKKERPAIREIPKSQFRKLTGMGELLELLFDLKVRREL